MAAIISEAEVAAVLEEALAEHFDDMENSSSEENSHESKPETMRYSFEPKNKNTQDVRDMNEYVLSYFESLNSMSRRIIAEQREVMAEQGSKWKSMSPEEQEKLIDDRIADPAVRKHYFVDESFSSRKPDWFPVLRLAHGISGSDRSVMNPRDSITSVTEFHSKDQFSSPWSWETRSQQDLRLLDEGELEAQLKITLEADLKALHLPVAAEHPKKDLNDVEIESKDSSQSGSVPGSESLSRKKFMTVEFDGLKDPSAASSIQGSKGSLTSSLSLPKGSKASLASMTPPKGSKASLASNTPPKGSKASLASATPQKESESNLVSSTPPKGSQDNLSSSLVIANEPVLQTEEAESQADGSTDTKDVDVSAASNSSDFMSLFQDW